MATASGHAGQVTVTITAASAATTTASDANGGLDTTSSTLSLIYIYSTSSTTEPTDAASSSYASASSHHISGGAIAGIVVGSVALLAILALSLFCYSRHVARRKRAEIASLQPGHHTPPTRAYSRATTIQAPGGASTNGRTTRNSHYARSTGDLSTATARRSLKSPGLLLPALPPQELPTPHNRPELDGSRGVYKLRSQKSARSRPGVAEVYGSVEQPIELQAGSMTDLVAVIQEMKRMKATGPEGGSSRGQRDGDSDTQSGGFLSPAWPPPGGATTSESGLVSDMDGTADGTETEYGEGAADAGSIHIYYRSSAATIAAAMSQASSMKGPRSTIRSSSTTARLV